MHSFVHFYYLFIGELSLYSCCATLIQVVKQNPQTKCLRHVLIEKVFKSLKGLDLQVYI